MRLQQVVIAIKIGFTLTNLVRSLVVVAHGWKCVTGIITALHCTVIHGALIVNLGVLLQVALVLKSEKERIKVLFKHNVLKEYVHILQLK